ncbi:MAG: hypothetical protein WA191_10990 [Telluria sp.]
MRKYKVNQNFLQDMPLKPQIRAPDLIQHKRSDVRSQPVGKKRNIVEYAKQGKGNDNVVTSEDCHAGRIRGAVHRAGARGA